MTMLAWHFVGDRLRDGRPVPPDGKPLRHSGDLVMCVSGLHASVRILDALLYAPGDTICRVRCGGEIIAGTNKIVCRRRTILWRIDGEEVLRRFARRQALTVAHLWDMPPVVREYLETGHEDIRNAARVAANAASVAAGWAVAWAARDAARAAAEAAGPAAAWAAAWAARDAATAGDAPQTVAATAARDAAMDAANTVLTEMVMEADPK